MKLTEDNITAYATSNYLLTGMSYMELIFDLRHLTYVGNSLKKFKSGDNTKLLINQLIIVFNTFEPEAAVNLLLFRIDKRLHPRLKAALMVFGVWFDSVHDEQIEADESLLTAVKEDLNEWRREPCQL